jgi:predicted polyphosphate/ATP-dependent NAD kinase
MAERFRIGFLLNPVAGLGGPAGLKGSDDEAAVAPLVEQTPYEQSPGFRRAVETFTGLALKDAHVVAAPGILGAEPLKVTISRGGPFFEVVRLGVPAKPYGRTTAEDTRRFAKALVEARVDLLVFAGGDGTALDVAEAVAGAVPILGIPTGVKMFSGVFAQTPAMAHDILTRMRPGFPSKEVEVSDLDEDSYRQGSFIVRSHAIARTPEDEAIQLGKGAGALSEEDALGDLVDWFGGAQEGGVVYVVGAGSTTMAIKRALGGGTALGVDVYRDGAPLALDADAATVRRLVDEAASVRILVSPTATQGCVLGRGTAQIPVDVVQVVGPEHVVVVATPSKLTGTMELFVDTGDPGVDASFPDYLKVRTDPFTEKMMRLRKPEHATPRGQGATHDPPGRQRRSEDS